MDQVNAIEINRRQDRTQSPSAYVGYFDHNAWLDQSGRVYQQYIRSDELAPPSFVVILKDEAPHSSDWGIKFSKLGQLREGWNGYAAPAPTETAIRTAKNFVDTLLRSSREPKRVAPSSVGGVAVTDRRGNKKAYVEFYNDGRVFAMFSDGESEPTIKQVEPGLQSFKRLITEMEQYLDA